MARMWNREHEIERRDHRHEHWEQGPAARLQTLFPTHALRHPESVRKATRKCDAYKRVLYQECIWYYVGSRLVRLTDTA